ncbi:MAG TPA: beta-ketoacyl-[acyl-carrier-protein] synthase family protein [Gemmataceae bacterium]|jgi:3-oxoacyl-[acyl-carrier-protein] synthase II
MDRRVVITGIGVVTPLGVGRERVWGRLLAGHSGVGPVRSFDATGYRVNRAAEVADFRPADYVRRLDPARLGRASQFAVAAARLALADAAAADLPWDPVRVGVFLGTTSGEPGVVERFDDGVLAGGPDGTGPDLTFRYPSHVLAAHVAAELRAGGVNAVLPAACAAGNYAVAFAADALRAGRADVVLAGSADAFSRITYAGFARLGAIAPDRCQPFDRNRKGMVPGEGAAVLVLERAADAARRGARPFAEVAGHGLTCDAHHATSMHPDGRGAARAMALALEESGVRPAEVGYISAHGTGTPTNDRVETLAIKRVFGDAAYRVPVSSVKSMLGHAMGAASAIEAAVCALAVATGHIPPTINLDDPDPECDLDYVPHAARACPVTVAVNNAYGFGGANSSLVLRSCGA